MTTSNNLDLSKMEEMLEYAGEAACLLKKMGNEYRLLVLCSLIGGERSVGELNEMMPLSQSALSQHLASLRKAGLVGTRREAQTIYYSLRGSEAIKVLEVLQAIYCPHI